MTVDVNKLKCNFVYEVNRFLQRRKYYNVNVCIDNALQAYVYYLLSIYTDCNIPHEIKCDLNNLNIKDLTIDCDEIITVINCDNQADLTLKYDTQLCTNNSVLQNSIDQSSFASVTLTDNEIYQTASINLITTSTCGENLSTTINSGSYEYGGTTQTSSSYNPHVRVTHVLPSVTGSPNGYIDKLYIYVSTPTITQVELNLSPLTTTYASFSGSPYVVNTNDLYFGSTQFPIALRQLIENAMFFLYGNKDIGLWAVDLLGGHLRISSAVKHNPTGLWAGLKPYNSFIRYYVNPITKFVTSSPANTLNSVIASPMSKTVNVVTPCGTRQVFVSGTPLLNLNVFETDFNKIVLNSPITQSNMTLTGMTTSSCNRYLLTGNENISNTEVSSRQWKQGPTILSNSNQASVYSTGTYTYTITLNNNCIITDNITVT